MSMSRILLSFVIPFVVASGSVDAQELLSWKLKSGEQLNYSVVQNMQTSMKMADKNVNTAMSQAMDMSWKVRDVENESMVMNQAVTRIRMKMEGGPAGTLEFDTNNKEATDNQFLTRMREVFGKIVNQAFQVTMTASGKVQDVQVPPLLLEAVRQSAAGNSGALSEDTLKDMMRQSAVVLPDQPVGPNSTWTSSQTIKMPPFGTMSVNSEMKFVQTDAAGNVVIDVVPQISVVPSDNAQMRMTLTSSKGRGRVLFNNTTGRVVQSQLELTMQMKVETNGQSFNQVIKQTTSMKLVP